MKIAPILTTGLTLLLISCGPSGDAPTGLLPQEERAPQFDRVSEFLDLGGVFYAYVDLTNEAEALGRKLTEIFSAVKESLPEMPPVPLDFENVMSASGVSGLAAIGMSSREIEGNMFHNRSILFFPKGVSGFFRVFGSEPHPFDSMDLAPSTSDLVFELSYRPAEIRDTILAIGDALAGPLGRGVITAKLHSPMPELNNRTLNQVIEGIGNRGMAIVDFNQDAPIEIESFATFPTTNFLLALDGVTELLLTAQPLIEQQPEIEWAETETGFTISFAGAFPPPADYIQPILVADTTTERIFIASNQAFLDECLQNSDKLKNTEAFRKAANLLPAEGVLFSYISPEYSEALLSFLTSSTNASPLADPRLAEILNLLIPSIDQPAASVTTVGPEGLYTASNLNYSHRTTIASLAVQPVAIVAGMSAAMAIPAFNQVRTTSQEKAILNNLRQFAAGGQQYMLEEGALQATYDDVVPEYVRELKPVDGEEYTELIVEADGGVLGVTTASGMVVDYPYH